MSLVAHIRDDMKLAMKSGEKFRLGVIRLILAAFKQVEVDQRIELTDEHAITILDKMVKQRRESVRQYRDAGREELAAAEETEILVIQAYMPQALSEQEVDAMVQAAVAATGAASVKDMGKVMAVLKPQMQGRADMALVSAKIKASLPG